MSKDQNIFPIDKNVMVVSPDGSSPHLIAGRCSSCGKHFFPPKKICPSCFDHGQIEEIVLSGRGKLSTFTVVRRNLGNKKLPYALGYIDTSWNLRIFASLTDCDLDRLTIGMDMEVVFEGEETEEGRKWITYKFRPVKDS
jgi:uncharacterized OB-fold protein